MLSHKLSITETEEINKSLKVRMEQLDRVISDAGKLVSELTGYPSCALAAVNTSLTIRRFDFIDVDPRTLIAVLMLSNNTVKNKLMNLTRTLDEGFLLKLSAVFNANFTNCPESEMDVTLISSVERATGDIYGIVASIASFAIRTLSETETKRTFLTGTSHILEHPEYRDWNKAHKLMNYLSHDENVLSLPVPEGDSDVKILIGPENLAEELRDSSVVVAKYDMGDGVQGLLGVVGPTRMDYAKVAANLSYIAKGMKAVADGKETQLPVLGKEDSENE
jgi:heat-inducible transcriptional repressor